MKKLLFLFVVLAASLQAATGDITVTINPVTGTGSLGQATADLTIAGFTSGATYTSGMTANNVPGTSTPYFTVVSLGYDSTGAATTVTRTVYITTPIRFPFGTATLPGSFTSGTFIDGETVTQATSGATAIVVGGQASGTKLTFRAVTGVFDNSHVVTGGTSGATFTSSGTITTLTAGTKYELVSGTGMTVRVALSDYIYQKDNTGGGNSGTAPTVTIPAAYVTNSGGAGQTSNALSAAAVTQNSNGAFQLGQGNWSRPGYQIATGNFQLAMVGFNHFGQSGAPFRCVIFTVTDTHSHTYTTPAITAMTIDATQGDAVPVPEYIGTIDVTGLTQGDTLTCNFSAYPWVGDAPLTSVGGASMPSPLLGPITWVLDKTGAYGTTVAGVDPVNGVDASGTAVDIANYVVGTTPRFKSISKAYSAIAAFNNTNHSRNDAGGGFIYITNAGSTKAPWVGGSNAYGNTPAAWCTITREPGTTQANAQIGDYTTGDASLKGRTRLYDVKIATTGNVFNGDAAMWIDHCTINSPSGALLINTCNSSYWTQNTLTAFGQGFIPNSINNTSFSLVRGMDMTALSPSIFCYTVLGNLKTSASGTVLMYDDFASSTNPQSVNTIVAYNRFTGSLGGSPMVNLGNLHADTTYGFAFVQNLLENVANSGTALAQLCADTSLYNNQGSTVWNNDIVGQRLNMGYNDSGTSSVARLYWSVKNNVIGDFNIKSDTFAGTANGNRTGNWSLLYGAGMSGNVWMENIASSGASGSFISNFIGINSIEPTPSGEPPSGTPNAAGYPVFVNDLSWHTGSATAGNGDYHFLPASPLNALQRDLVIPFALDGAQRNGNDAAGAYHYGSAGNFFLFF